MADCDSEIEFNTQHNNREMEEDRPLTDTEEIIQQQEHDELDQAASVLSSIDNSCDLDVPGRMITWEFPWIHMLGDLSGNARRPISHTSTPMKPQTYNGDEDWESYLSHFEVGAELGRWSLYDTSVFGGLFKRKCSSLFIDIDARGKVILPHTDSKIRSTFW